MNEHYNPYLHVQRCRKLSHQPIAEKMPGSSVLRD